MSRRYGTNFVVVCPRPARISHLFPKNCRYEYIPTREIEKNSYQFFELRLKGVFSLRKQLKDIPPESSVVLSRLSILDVPAWFSRRELSRRSFFVRHSGNGLFENFATKSVIHSSVAKLAERINRMVLESADCVDFLNEKLLNQFIKNIPGLRANLFCVGNGVDLDVFTTKKYHYRSELDSLKKADIVFGYFGGHPSIRGGVEVIKTLFSARADGVHAYAMIVGDSGDLDVCRALVKTLGLDKFCIILGRVAFDETPALMSAIDIGFSILRPEERMESEQKVRQYLACNHRVVVSSGSNDFLIGSDFALVVDNVGESLWLEMKDKFGRDVRNWRATPSVSREYAEKNLSYHSLNETRLKHWNEFLSEE